METFEEYLEGIENTQHRARVTEVLSWISDRFPDLGTRIAWNQPMFTDHGTFIIGFSVAKKHMAIAPERAAIQLFSEEFSKAGYEYTSELFRIKWEQPVDYTLLEKIILFNRSDKAECTTFWRK